jgi:hypothetical protein
LSIRKSSSFFPPLIAATSQRGLAPRPAHVSPEGPRYFGGIGRGGIRLKGMGDFGHSEGDNFDFAARFADGYIERLPPLAQELVQLRPRVILAPASGPAVAAKAATAIIPIVCPALADAVHLGLVASVSRPGSNVTGRYKYPKYSSKPCTVGRYLFRSPR